MNPTLSPAAPLEAAPSALDQLRDLEEFLAEKLEEYQRSGGPTGSRFLVAIEEVQRTLSSRIGPRTAAAARPEPLGEPAGPLRSDDASIDPEAPLEAGETEESAGLEAGGELGAPEPLAEPGEPGGPGEPRDHGEAEEEEKEEPSSGLNDWMLGLDVAEDEFLLDFREELQVLEAAGELPDSFLPTGMRRRGKRAAP